MKVQKFPVKAEDRAHFYALYFGEKYGLIFGQGDLVMDFDHPGKCRSRLGATYEAYGEPYALAGRETDWEVAEVEVFSVGSGSVSAPALIGPFSP